MKTIETMSTDELIQAIYWSRDRRAYRRACNINAPADSAADNAFESACYAELTRRGVDRF